MLTIDDGQPVVVVHQLVGGVGDAGSSAHGKALLLLTLLLVRLLLRPDDASFRPDYASARRSSLQADSLHAIGDPAVPDDFRFIKKVGADDAALADPAPRRMKPVIDVLLDVYRAAEKCVTGRG